ncbi:chloride channel protein [Paraflavitalea sp. CAU 1676]|uniref:chloride channel protein n=1 Tax=Paraflavitalea sp. CAU 1676 TaxID=3032598 RepID=UPI0023D99DF3|nr:chloride channel protein [Paraflavitalea sp. CAU 1676]MDF2193684.1 chloride channel protein [Paraflavitalea sp. CAU 1676]
MKQMFVRVRGILKTLFDRINNETLKRNLLQAIPFWIASLITGLIAVCYAVLFGWAENGAAWVIHHHGWLMLIATPACFLLAWWLVAWFAPYARGSGIPQVIAAVELTNPITNDRVKALLSLRIIVVKIVSSLIMVLGGAVVGREGPTIQIAGSVFRKVNQWLPAWWPKISRRNMIKAGAAAGLAAAFNTPLGGLVFAVEELTRTHISYFKTALFTSVILAGLTAQALLGPYLYLGYPEVSNLSHSLFFIVIMVAILAGLSGAGMAKVILWVLAWVKGFKSRSRHILYTIICALIIAVIGVYFDERMFGSGKELMTHTLFTGDKELPWYVPVFRIAGSILSFTTGGAGGVFAPALGAGAGVGSVVGGWFHLTDGNMNVVILAGMVAFLTGVTRTPFTSFILVLEMTDRHNVIFHLMLAGMVSSLVSFLVDRHSFYDHLKHIYKKELTHEPLPAS